jgi:hypothetical protein
MKHATFFTLPGAVILLLSSFASNANAQANQPPAQALVPCQQNYTSGCTLFAAYDSNIDPYWYYNPNANPESNGLGKDPVFQYINGVNTASGLTNSSLPTQGLWVGVVPVNTTVSYLGGAGDNSTSFGTCTSNNYNLLTQNVTKDFGPPTQQPNYYYLYTAGYSCH